MSERKLATIRKIAEITPIPNADKICTYKVDGWCVVDSIGKYQLGELVVMCEIDSWVPTAVAPFLTKPGHEPKEFEGIKGERLRTVKLRGQLSQGLLLPLSVLGKPEEIFPINDNCIDTDVTGQLGVLKWERPLPAQLAGTVKGNFPSFIPKTDQNRIQNCGRQLQSFIEDQIWEITEKLDGSSMTVYVNHNELDEEGAPNYGVCSRNLDLKRDESNSFWEAAIKNQLIEKIKSTGRSFAIQGELIGEGIQGNPYKLTGRHFFCFDIWDIEKQVYLLPHERIFMCEELDIQHVPFISTGTPMVNIPLVSSDDILRFAEGKSPIGCKPEREGLVFKSVFDHDVSFKAISNRWLLKGGE